MVPTLEWYREQSKHNKEFYEWLHRVRPSDAHDWKVNALFYSALHRVNYCSDDVKFVELKIAT